MSLLSCTCLRQERLLSALPDRTDHKSFRLILPPSLLPTVGCGPRKFLPYSLLLTYRPHHNTLHASKPGDKAHTGLSSLPQSWGSKTRQEASEMLLKGRRKSSKKRNMREEPTWGYCFRVPRVVLRGGVKMVTLGFRRCVYVWVDPLAAVPR